MMGVMGANGNEMIEESNKATPASIQNGHIKVHQQRQQNVWFNRPSFASLLRRALENKQKWSNELNFFEPVMRNGKKGYDSTFRYN